MCHSILAVFLKNKKSLSSAPFSSMKHPQRPRGRNATSMSSTVSLLTWLIRMHISRGMIYGLLILRVRPEMLEKCTRMERYVFLKRFPLLAVVAVEVFAGLLVFFRLILLQQRQSCAGSTLRRLHKSKRFFLLSHESD